MQISMLLTGRSPFAASSGSEVIGTLVSEDAAVALGLIYAKGRLRNMVRFVPCCSMLSSYRDP